MASKYKINPMYIKTYTETKESLLEFSVEDLEEHVEGLKLDVRSLRIDTECSPNNYKLRDVFRRRTAEYDSAKDLLKERKTLKNELTARSRLINTTNLLHQLRKDFPSINWTNYAREFPNSALAHILENS